MKKIFLLATAALSMCFASCSLDDVENVGELSTSVFPATDAEAEAVIAGVYQNLNAVHANPQMSFLYYAQLASDDALGGGGTNDKLMQAMDLLCNYNADMTNQFYLDRYSGIARANTILGILAKNETMDKDMKSQLVGEAKFLRAFYYYELASFYGNVPLTTNAEDGDVKQGDYKTLWGQILKDLYESATQMPSVTKTNGHVDKYTAEAMLGRAWLFASGMFCNGFSTADMVSTKYSPLTEWELPAAEGEKVVVLTKQMVADLLEDCIKNSNYSLVKDFRNLWAYTNRFVVEDYDYTKNEGLKWVENDNAVNPESMFAIKFNKQASWQTTIGYANGYALHFGVRGGQDVANTFPFGQGWGAGPVASNLVVDWATAEPQDIRREATIQTVSKLPNYAYGGWADFVQETDYYAKKWAPVCAKNDGSVESLKKDETPYVFCFETLMYPNGWEISGENNFQLSNIHDLVLIRFADVLLMHAELTDGAIIKEGREDFAGMDGLNIVRKRVGLPKVTYSLSALQNERRWEFAEEGIRWNDIRRWHIAAAALEKQTDTPVYYCGAPAKNTAHNGGYAARYNATAGFVKIPESVISIGSCVQNDGWTDATSEYTGW